MDDPYLGLLQGLNQGVQAYMDRSTRLEELGAKEKKEAEGLLREEQQRKDQRDFEKQKLKAEYASKGINIDFDEQGNVVQKGFDPEYEKREIRIAKAKKEGSGLLPGGVSTGPTGVTYRDPLKQMKYEQEKSQSEFKSLPLESQEQIKTLAGKTATAKSIKNAIDAALVSLEDPKISDEQKLTAGRALIKTLNSTQGQDAVGAEEAKRLAGFLEYRMGNLFEPGPFIGRDLKKFNEQVKIQRDTLGGLIKANEASTNQLYGRQTPPPTPETKQWGGKTYIKQGDMWVEVK